MLNKLITHATVVKLTEVFSAHNADLYLVGGSIRDALSGTPNFADLDFTTSLRPASIKKIVSSLGPIWDVGEKFGTIGVTIFNTKVEITTFRKESYDSLSRKPVVSFGNSIQEDLARRDLTINAIALNLSKGHVGEVVDPFNGQVDLLSNILRTPDLAIKTMSEDPLRQIRVVRFAAKRKMIISVDLQKAIKETSPRLEIVARERITDELRKIMGSGSEVFHSAILLAQDLTVDKFLLGALTVSLEKLEALKVFTKNPLSVLVFKDSAAKEKLFSLKLSKDEISKVLNVSLLAEKIEIASEIELRALVRASLIEDLFSARELLLAFNLLTKKQDALFDAAVFLLDELKAPLPVSGDDFLQKGFEGKAVGRLLKQALQLFLSNPSVTKEEIFTHLAFS